MFIIFSLVILPVAVVAVSNYLNKNAKPPIFGVYQQENKFYWLKFLFMYVYLTIRQFVIYYKRLYLAKKGKNSDAAIHITRDDEALERKHNIADFTKGVDAVYFNGMSQEAAVICGLARRPQHTCDTFLYIKLNNKELLLSPKLPDTYHEQTSAEAGHYVAGGLKIENSVPMRTWKLTYNGEMKVRNSPEKTVHVQAEFTFSAQWAPFNYDFQMSPKNVAKDMAREPWSRDYFKKLQECHQSHYEQMGILKGTVKVDGKEQVLQKQCVRDHTFGKFRDWSVFHRYVLHFIFLDNGDCMEIGTVSQPNILSQVTIGYLCRKSDQAVVPIESCSFNLYQHGENQTMPKDYAFTFEADGEQHVVKVLVDDEETFYIGKDRIAKLHERWSRVEVNGVRGLACLEWHYNNAEASEGKKE